MLDALASLAPAVRRRVLLGYASQHPEVLGAVTARVREPGWAPTPADCPVPWDTLREWSQGLQRTGQLVMDSY